MATETRIGRRQLLKRVGLGAAAAAAWSAPIIVSTATPAHAAPGGSKCGKLYIRNARIAPCAKCNSQLTCGPPGSTGDCFCHLQFNGCCACVQPVSIKEATVCAKASDCPPGWRCIYNCYGEQTRCFPDCSLPLP
jgi:hypothetical protein